MTPATKQLLDRIITDQEGGWKLTSNANDPDGGWTYGGCTAKVFSHWHLDAAETGHIFTAAEFSSMFLHADGGEEATKVLVYECYDKEYITPLQLEKLSTILQGPVLSCAINRGVETAVKILQISTFPYLIAADCDGKMGSKTLAAIEKFNATSTKNGYSELITKFLREWTRSYIQLVVENAKAWHDWAEVSHDSLKAGAVPSGLLVNNIPTIFRAGDLEGWFNRVEYWRT